MENKSRVRLESLDVLRGFDMFFIMGGLGLFIALSTLFPCALIEALAQQMKHVSWHVFAFMDMIFPLFLFIQSLFSEYAEPLLSALGYILVCWLFMYFLYKKKMFLKV